MLRKALARGRMRWLMIGPFLVVVALLAGMAVASVDILSAVRAYVGGESLWSKGQKDAAYHLGRYINGHDPLDYLRFQNALSVPLGDRRARIALENDPPDLSIARQGFLDGGNHPDDVDAMIELFLRFRRVSFMADAITIWTAADAELAELGLLAGRVHERIAAGDTSSPELQALAGQLPALNERLTGLEARFSATLGQASRTARWLVLVGTLVLAGGLSAGGIFLTAYVLRQQVQVETELRESNARWALAAEAAGMGLFEWDLHNGHASMDARAAALYGLDGPVSGMKVSALTRDMVHPEDAARFGAAVSQLIAHPASATQRYRLLLPGGVVRHIEAIANVSRNNDGVGARMVGVLRDVSDQIRAVELQLEKEAAERATRAKGEFLSRVSHELRTPLNAVLGFAELVQTDPIDAPTPVQKQRIQHVLDAGRHLLALINDILDLSSLDESAAPLPVASVALAAALQNSLHHVETLARAQQVVLEVGLPAQALCVLADARRLEQVFTNLLSNAIKYNRLGGEVAVLCECVDDEVRVTVRDTGPGLRPDQVARLFQPFNRLGAEFSKVQGSGLGLVITQQLVKRMGGSLQVHSTEGVGTRMVVRLRAAPQLDQVAAAGT